MQRKRQVRALSWVPIDANYENREGYDSKFLGANVPLPRSRDRQSKERWTREIVYEHFSVVLHKTRKLAAYTAVNIDGRKQYRMKDRAQDSWREDPRAAGYQTGKSFYRRPFHRGHLVRRLDPAWGNEVEGQRAEADTFHWTNCAPQHGTLNTRWWLGVEEHVLKTAEITRQRVSVFAGPVFGDQDPTIRKVKVPLAFWKVIVWKPRRRPGLRSLGFLVRQDRLVIPLARARGLSVDFSNTPKKVQAYQTTVAEIARLSRLSFGALEKPHVDVYAARRRQRAAALMLSHVDTFRPLESLADLIVD